MTKPDPWRSYGGRVPVVGLLVIEASQVPLAPSGAMSERFMIRNSDGERRSGTYDTFYKERTDGPSSAA